MRIYHMCAAVLALAAVAVAGETPEVSYRQAYLIIRSARQAEYMGERDLAWHRFREAGAAMERIRREHPDWNTDGVAAQVRVCEEGAARTMPSVVAAAEGSLGAIRGSAGAMGQLQQRKVAFQKQMEWERRKLDDIEGLMRRFVRMERARRILGLERGAAITEEQIKLAERRAGSLIPEEPTKAPRVEEEKKDMGTVDTDGDGIPDIVEAKLGTDPTKQDTDGDKLSDYEEVNVYRTDPLDVDTDGDEDEDGWEVEQGYDPLDPKPWS